MSLASEKHYKPEEVAAAKTEATLWPNPAQWAASVGANALGMSFEQVATDLRAAKYSAQQLRYLCSSGSAAPKIFLADGRWRLVYESPIYGWDVLHFATWPEAMIFLGHLLDNCRAYRRRQ